MKKFLLVVLILVMPLFSMDVFDPIEELEQLDSEDPRLKFIEKFEAGCVVSQEGDRYFMTLHDQYHQVCLVEPVDPTDEQYVFVYDQLKEQYSGKQIRLFAQKNGELAFCLINSQPYTIKMRRYMKKYGGPVLMSLGSLGIFYFGYTLMCNLKSKQEASKI